jgi:hypothetical protein
LLASVYANSLPSLLSHLDRLAPRLAKDADPIDAHIAAFIANRLGILHDIKLPELIPHPSLATHKGMMSLHLIATAQSRCGNLKLPGLCLLLAGKIMPALDIIKSRTLRSRLIEELQSRTQSGYTQLMAEAFIHSNYAVADVTGLVRASQTYHQNNHTIAYFKKEEVIEYKSSRLGFAIAKCLAYLLFAIVLYRSW